MDLSKVKLKKTSLPEIKVQDIQLCETSEQYKQMMEDTYIEKYFENIQDFSFPAIFRPLTRNQAQSICSFHKKGESNSLWKNELVLKELEKDIEETMKKSGWNKIFVRLSSRSPKDAALLSPHFLNLFDENRQFIQNEEKREKITYEMQEMNTKLHALYRASTYSLSAQNGSEAIQFLIDSDRIQGDLEQYVKGEITDFQIVIREFRTFDPDLEFRGFVYQGKFTGLTQYNEFVYFPVMESHKDEILKLIKEQMEKIISVVPLKNFVVDFVLCVSKEEQYFSRKDRFLDLKVFVVEVNPFAEFAGSGLFTWEKDKPLLLGKKPFEFRVHEKVPEFALENVPENWKRHLS